MIQAAQNQKQINIGKLVKLPLPKIGATVILTTNRNIQDFLINGQVVEVANIVIYDPQAGLKKMNARTHQKILLSRE